MRSNACVNEWFDALITRKKSCQNNAARKVALRKSSTKLKVERPWATQELMLLIANKTVQGQCFRERSTLFCCFMYRIMIRKTNMLGNPYVKVIFELVE